MTFLSAAVFSAAATAIAIALSTAIIATAGDLCKRNEPDPVPPKPDPITPTAPPPTVIVIKHVVLTREEAIARLEQTLTKTAKRF